MALEVSLLVKKQTNPLKQMFLMGLFLLVI